MSEYPQLGNIAGCIACILLSGSLFAYGVANVIQGYGIIFDRYFTNNRYLLWIIGIACWIVGGILWHLIFYFGERI